MGRECEHADIGCPLFDAEKMRRGVRQPMEVGRYRILKTPILLLSIVIAPTSFSATESRLSIQRIDPKPNYPITADRQDAKQLVDGRVIRFPAWTKKSSVGWKDSSFIRIVAENTMVSPHLCGDVTVSIAAGLKPSAGVYLPRRIDFYSGETIESLTHVGSLVVEENEYTTPMSVDLTEQLDFVGNVLVLSVHAAGRYVMIDEISILPRTSCASNILASELFNYDNLRVDSTRRLKDHFENTTTSDIAYTQALTIEDIAPYSSTPLEETAQTTTVIGEHGITARYFNGDADLLVRVSGECPPNGYHVSAGLDDAGSSDVELFHVGEVLSFSGLRTYDPLIPLRGERLPCRAENSPTLLWIKVVAIDNSIVERGLSLTVGGDENESANLRYTLFNVENIKPGGRCVPKVVTWGYSIDKPIWRNTELAMKFMLESHVNVHVIPWQLLSPTKNEKFPSRLGLRRAVGEMKLAKRLRPDVEFLLFVRFDRWMRLNKGLKSNEKMIHLIEWSKAISNALEAEGIQQDEWYLYPIDEPTSGSADILIRLADSLKSSIPGIRLYANPIDSRTHRVSNLQLRRMASRIDLLQPNLVLALKSPSVFSERPWWFFDNPKSPAKDTDPKHYRSLGIRAALLGASGFGFWSYSDTSSSSAWDDFDGRRPDWAAVYESDQGIVSSRRWEAFKRGISDYRMLCNRILEIEGRRKSADPLGEMPETNAPAVELTEFADLLTRRVGEVRTVRETRQ
ncbi:MAG: hypothetical protein ACI8XZ_003960 [Gammaproteobacteria bacterium]|jgi:hypothetical protein